MDRAGVCDAIEAAMPTGGRPRQLRIRTLLVGLLLALSEHRPAHLCRVHGALVALPAGDRERLGITTGTASGPHTLTYRQVERTVSTMTAVLAAAGGALADRLADALVEATIPGEVATASTSVAVDWTDVETWSRPTERDASVPAADPDAAWGHRTTNQPGARGEHFFGYYAQAVTMVRDEAGPAVPELVRRIALEPCSVDPPPAMVTLLNRMRDGGITVGDVIADSGYSHRVAERWAAPLRALGVELVVDLHPADRGPKGTHAGAVMANGNLYCPATPRALLELAPPGFGPSASVVAAHDAKVAELSRYKFGRHSADGADGSHRVTCPAVMGKLRCPLKVASMTLPFDRPEVIDPPGERPRCCAQDTVTVTADINAKTRQKHDYLSPAHRRSYARRTAVERVFSTLKDTASTSIRRGWCRLMGRTKNLVMLVAAVAVRNLRVLAAFAARSGATAAT